MLTLRIFWLWAAAIMLMATPVEAQNPLEFYETKQRAADAFRSGEYERSIQLYSQVVAVQALDSRSLRRLWISHSRVGSLAEAILLGEGLHALEPQDANLAYSIARLHAESKHRDETIKWLGIALESGFEDRPEIVNDDVFAGWKSDPRFRDIAGIPPDSLTRNEGWRFDLDYFIEEALRLHADPSRPTEDPEFSSAVQRLRASIPSLSDDEVVLELMRLAAMLGDGHTAIYGPGADSQINVDAGSLPVLFYLFSDGLFVVDATSDWSHLIGARVDRIGPVTPEEALDRLLEYRGVDNGMTIKWLGVHFYLRRLLMLRGIGATEEPGAATLEVVLPDGTPTTVRTKGGDYDFRRKLRAPRTPDGPVPAYLRRVDVNYWMEPLPDDCAVYLQFNQVRDIDGAWSLAEFARALSDTISASQPRYIVVDVRHNNGGNNTLVRPLVRTLIGFEESSEENQIFVITGRNTFSAAQNFVNRVERLTDAVFVGEPSSSSPNFVGEETNLVLPWSRVRGSISSKYWQDSDPWDHRVWITPDVPVALSSSEYFSGRDPAMEAVESLMDCSR